MSPRSGAEGRRRGAGEAVRADGARGHAVRAGEVGQAPLDAERAAAPGGAPVPAEGDLALVDEGHAPALAGAVGVHLELRLDRGVVGLELELGGRAGAAAA